MGRAVTGGDDRSGDPGHDRSDDARRFDELSAVVRRFDPVPDGVRAAARAAFALRSLDDDLAALVHDSQVDDDRLVGVRGGSSRTLTFEGRALTVEVDVAPGGVVVGQLVPPQPGSVDVRHRDGSVRVEADDLGRFVAEGVPPGPVSLRCHGRDAAEPTSTDWVVL